MYSLLLRELIMPAISLLTPHKAWRYYQQFIKGEYDPPKLRQQRQWQKLIELLDHAYRNVPFYHEKFKQAGIKPQDIKTSEDFLQIPITTKEEIRRNYPSRMLAKNYLQKKLRFSNTSGTTGRGLMLVQNPEDINYKYAAKLRSRRLEGTHIGASILRITANECQPCLPSGNSPKRKFLHYLLRLQPQKRDSQSGEYYIFLEKNIINPFFHRRRMLSPFKTLMRDDDFLYYLQEIGRYRPDILVIYPLYLHMLCHFIELKKLYPPKVGIIDLSGGLSTHKMRQYAHRILNAKIYQSYGGCEFSRYANECEENTGLMHILEDFCYIEFLNKNGYSSQPRELSNIIATSLTNYAMPIIRLESGDVGWYEDQPCPCGRTTKLMDIGGRLQGLIVTQDGKTLSTQYFLDKYLDTKGLKLFQIIQRNENMIDFLGVVDSNDKVNVTELYEKLKDDFGEGVSIQIKFVDFIRQQPSCKYLLVKSSTYKRFRCTNSH